MLRCALQDYTPEKIQTANHREATAATSPSTTDAAACGFDAEQQHCRADPLDKGPPQPPQAMREHSLSAIKQQIVPAPAAPKRSLFSDTPQHIAVSQKTIAAAHRDVVAAAHTPIQSPIHSATASPEKTPFGQPSRIEKQVSKRHAHCTSTCINTHPSDLPPYLSPLSMTFPRGLTHTSTPR